MIPLESRGLLYLMPREFKSRELMPREFKSRELMPRESISREWLLRERTDWGRK
jgi:hypothetical protein